MATDVKPHIRLYTDDWWICLERDRRCMAGFGSSPESAYADWLAKHTMTPDQYQLWRRWRPWPL